MMRGKPLAELPDAQPAAPPPPSSLMRMKGFPLMVMGNAFCAPTLPSFQVIWLMTRYWGFAFRAWKSLTSRMAKPFPAAVSSVTEHGDVGHVAVCAEFSVMEFRKGELLRGEGDQRARNLGGVGRVSDVHRKMLGVFWSGVM